MATKAQSNKRKQGIITLIVLAVLGLSYFFKGNDPEKEKGPDKRKKEFRYNDIRYSNHARCRMDCREITEAEVKNILEKGKINYSKSDLKDKPCPTYALEGISDDRQKIRVVVGNCENEAVVITVIDLENEHACDCK